MKKRIMILSFVLCAVVCALSVNVFAAEPAPTYVAQIGETKFESIQAAVDAAEDEDTIKIIRDFETDCSDVVTCSGSGLKALVNVIDTDVTIDLNGKTIFVKPTKETVGSGNVVVFSVDGAGTLTLQDSIGTGTVAVTANDATVYALALCYGQGGKMNIESGSYSLDVGGNGRGMIYSQHDEVVTVSGGTFHLGNVGELDNGSPWILNASGQNTKNIIVTGGTFNANVFYQYYIFEAKDATEVSELLGIPVKAARDNGDGTWTIDDAVAYVDEYHSGYRQNTGYMTFKEAVAAAQRTVDCQSDLIPEGEYPMPITLLKKCEVDGTDGAIEITRNITINKAPSATSAIITSGGFPLLNVANGVTLTLTGGSYLGEITTTGTGKVVIDPANTETPNMTFAQDVTEWCVDGYVAVENDAGLYEVVEGYKVKYAVPANDNEIVYIEGVAADGEGTATGYTHVHPTLDKAIFDWYKTINGNNLESPVFFDTDVFAADTTIYGTYEDAVVVKFDSDGGTNVPAQAFVPIVAGVTVKEPAAPAKPNCTFDGWWYTEDETEKAFVFDANGEKVIMQSIKLHAKWLTSRTVSFVTNGGSAVAEVIVGDGRTLTSPTAPYKSGYTFAGWYTDETLETEYDFETAVTGDFTLYAKWDEVVYVPAYSIDAPEGVKLSPVNAWPGETVTVTIEDADMDGVRILDSKGNLIRVNGSDGVFKFVMPYGDVKVEAFALPFDDVSENDYFHDAVIWALANGITEGTSDTAFSPNAGCTRAQMVTFLWRAAGCPEPKTAESSFTDVDADSYYTKAVLWAVQNGITEGTGGGLFSPDAECSRAQMAVFLSRMEKGVPVGNSNPFTDVVADAYYADSVLWAYEAGITFGTGDGLFSPHAACSRAQMVTFLYRYYAE